MISGKAKMYDLIIDHPQLLLVLENFNIPLGLGEQSIQTICRKHGIDERLFLTIVNLYCTKGALHAQPAAVGDAMQVLAFLRNFHDYFLNEKIPALKKLAELPDAGTGDKFAPLIQKFIYDYAEEVFKHIQYENTVVFPYIEELMANRRSAYRIEQFKKMHSNLDEKLADLRSLLIKHVPPEYDSVVRRKMLFELYDLEVNLLIHDYIENHLLIPAVERLERRKQP